jgi:hypothetical protein
MSGVVATMQPQQPSGDWIRDIFDDFAKRIGQAGALPGSDAWRRAQEIADGKFRHRYVDDMTDCNREARRREHQILGGLNEPGISKEELLRRMGERYKELADGTDA